MQGTGNRTQIATIGGTPADSRSSFPTKKAHSPVDQTVRSVLHTNLLYAIRRML